MERRADSPTQVTLLEKKLAEEPIILPGSPFWDVFKTFGRDEMIALGINTVVTAGLSQATSSHLALSTAGPIAEKAGFFAAYFKEGWDLYRTTPKSEREPVSTYISDAIKQGMPGFTKDLLIHDPIYSTSMYLGLQAYPETPAWMLSMLTFIAAVGMVAAGEIAAKETTYQNQLRRLKSSGFRKEPLLEARFVIHEDDPEKLLEQITEEFDLGEIHTDDYHDRYFETKLKEYNARVPVFRFRERVSKETGEQVVTAQVVYTRASEVEENTPSQFNYFPTSKDKLRKDMDNVFPEQLSDIPDRSDQKSLKKFVTDVPTREVVFTRGYAHDPERLHASVDLIDSGTSHPFSIVELKTNRKKNGRQELLKSMRHLMYKYEVIQTTYTKESLTALNHD